MDTVVAYGHWPSPLSRPAQAAAGKVSLSELASDGTSVYWLESRPAEGGHVVFVRADGTGADGTGAGVVDMTPEGVSIRSRVHEYGGGASCLVPGHGPGVFAYVDGSDEGVWLHGGGDESPVSALRPTHGRPALGAWGARGQAGRELGGGSTGDP